MSQATLCLNFTSTCYIDGPPEALAHGPCPRKFFGPYYRNKHLWSIGPKAHPEAWLSCPWKGHSSELARSVEDSHRYAYLFDTVLRAFARSGVKIAFGNLHTWCTFIHQASLYEFSKSLKGDRFESLNGECVVILSDRELKGYDAERQQFKSVLTDGFDEHGAKRCEFDEQEFGGRVFLLKLPSLESL